MCLVRWIVLHHSPWNTFVAPPTENKACHNSDHPIIEASPPFSAPSRLHVHVHIPKNPKAVSLLGLHWKPSGTTGCAPGVTPFSMPSREENEEEEEVCRSWEKKKERGKKEKQSELLLPDFSAERARLSMPLREKNVFVWSSHSLFLSLSLLITASRLLGCGNEEIPHGREKGRGGKREQDTRSSLPSPFLSLRRSHRGNKKESRDRKTSISKHTVGTSWISENWKSVSPWDSTTARSHWSTSFLPISISPLGIQRKSSPDVLRGIRN